jgi:radical SAM-linked protein
MAKSGQRIRIAFCKGEEIRYISHLDMVRLWKRVLRRAKVPLAYSKGFNPQPKISIAAPLPVGFTGEEEVMDIFLERPVSLNHFARSVKKQTPTGITLKEVREVYFTLPSLQSQVRFAEYTVSPLDSEGVESQIEALLAAEAIPRERQGKEYDLRPLIDDLRLEGSGLWMRLKHDAEGAGRPDEVLAALGLEKGGKAIHRRRLIFASQLGEVS